MSNDYFKAQGWFKTYALNSQDSRGVFQELVKEDEEAFRLASAETDKIKEEMNKQFGSGTIKYGSEIPQPEMKTPQAIFEFSQRNPAAEGGRMKFDDGLSALNFGKEQNIFTPQSFQKILGAAGQRDYAPAYKVIINSLKKAGIEYTSPKSAGATATFDNVTKETIDIFNKEATKLKAEAGLPMSRYQTNQLKKDIKIFVKDKLAKGEYVSRPVIKEHFGLTEGKGGDMLITRSLGVNEKAGTGLLKNLGQDEQKAAAKANFAKATAATMETKNDVLKIINDEFRLDPDLSNSEDLAKTIYGDQFPKGDMKNMSIEDLRKAEAFVRQTDNDVMSYLRVIKGLRDKPDKMRLPTQNVINDITDNILSGIEDEAADGQSFKKKSFRFSSGILRDYKMALINKNLDLDPDTYRSERAKKILKNKNLDEIFSMSALAEIAPGYTTKVQSIKKLINTRKASEIDKPFQTIINALNEGKTSMQWNGKIVPIEDAIESFNKTSSKFSKREKVQSPKINYNEKFDESILDSYGKASQENIKKVYKDKNFFLSDINPKIKTQDVLVDYIDGKGSFVGVNSGFNTDLLMKDPLVQKILNSKSGQAIAKSLRGAAGTVGKVFGGADVVLGILDYQNNISKGQKHDEALGNAVQAMSFGLYKSGDRARVKEVKDIFVKNGGDGEIFDQATALNAKDQEINDLIFDSKKKADTFVRYAKEGRGVLTPDLEKSKSDYNVLKKNLNEEIKNKIQERDNMVESYKTNLRVSEAGAPIQIGGNEFFSQPFKDIKQATMDKIASDNKTAYDTQKRQVNYTAGKYGNWLLNNVFTLNSPEYREQQRLINNMDERELYKFNLQRGMDLDNLIRVEDLLNIKSSNPDLMGVNTTKYVNYDDRKAEGGITGLRSKYEYKK